MICPFCTSPNTYVRDSRQGDDGRYRRYVCAACGEKFSTVEKTVFRRPKNDLRRLSTELDMHIEALNKICLSLQKTKETMKNGNHDQ